MIPGAWAHTSKFGWNCVNPSLQIILIFWHFSFSYYLVIEQRMNTFLSEKNGDESGNEYQRKANQRKKRFVWKTLSGDFIRIRVMLAELMEVMWRLWWARWNVLQVGARSLDTPPIASTGQHNCSGDIHCVPQTHLHTKKPHLFMAGETSLYSA